LSATTPDAKATTVKATTVKATTVKATTVKAVHGNASPDVYVLRLYVAGQTPKSLAAITNLKRICDEHLPGRHQTEVIDLLQNPQLARKDQILAIPTLVRHQPLPVHKIIGDLSDTERALIALGLRERP